MKAMRRTGGAPIVVSEDQVAEALALSRAHTSVVADATGTAGLAGLLAARDRVRPGERALVLFTGRDRSAP